MSRLEKIWIKRVKRGPMDPADRAQLKAGRGIVGNANQGGKRQVTIISKKYWDEVTSPLGDVPDPRIRRANLLISEIDFTNESRGRILQIGTVRIRIYGETRPCERMEEAVAGLKKAMSTAWGGGAFGEVLDDGDIAVGDRVEWITEGTHSGTQAP